MLLHQLRAVTCSAHFALQCTDLCIANISYFICLLIAFSDFQIGGLTQHYSSVSASWWVLRPWNFSKQENSVIKLLKRHGRSISSQPSLKVPRIHSTCLILIILIHTKARFPSKRNRLRCVRCVNGNRKKRKRLPIGMLGRSSGNHDWLLANASACVSCGFRLRNARNASDCVWMETGLKSSHPICACSPLRSPVSRVHFRLKSHLFHKTTTTHLSDCLHALGIVDRFLNPLLYNVAVRGNI